MAPTFKIYPKLPTAPDDASFQEKFHVNTVRSEFSELLALKAKFYKKHVKYAKVLDRLIYINAGSNVVSVASGIGSAASAVSLAGLPISVPLAGVALGGAISSGICTMFIKKYKKKISRNEKLHDILTSAIAVFKTTISESLTQMSLINEREFKIIQGVYFKTLTELSSIDRKMKVTEQEQFQKNMLEELENLKKTLTFS
jgi:BMFP domain-containing protein YqiC